MWHNIFFWISFIWLIIVFVVSFLEAVFSKRDIVDKIAHMTASGCAVITMLYISNMI